MSEHDIHSVHLPPGLIVSLSEHNNSHAGAPYTPSLPADSFNGSRVEGARKKGHEVGLAAPQTTPRVRRSNPFLRLLKLGIAGAAVVEGLGVEARLHGARGTASVVDAARVGLGGNATEVRSDASFVVPAAIASQPVLGIGAARQAVPTTLPSPLPEPLAGSLSRIGDPVALNESLGGTYPRMTRLSDGSMLATFTTSAQGINHISVARSADNGTTWSAAGEVTKGVGDIDNGMPLQTSFRAPGATADRILVAFRNHTLSAPGVYKQFRLTVSASDDAAHTWKILGDLDSGTPPNGVWEPFLYYAPSGALQVYYARENALDDQDIIMRETKDGGATWGPRNIVAGSGIIARDGMPGVTTVATTAFNGTALVFETGINGRFVVHNQMSNDSGLTWTPREVVYAPGSRFNAGAPQVASLSNGVLVASFMTNVNSVCRALIL